MLLSTLRFIIYPVLVLRLLVEMSTSMGHPKGATVTESGIGSLASGKIRLPDGTILIQAK